MWVEVRMGEGSEGGDICVDWTLVGVGEIFGIRGDRE